MVVLAFIEDGSVEVFASRESAATKFEGIDVESGTVQFFEADGTSLRAEFTSPNRCGKICGPFGWVSSGAYTLVPNHESSGEAFALALNQASALEPNCFFSSIENLKSTLRAAGVAADIVVRGRQSAA